MIKTVRGKFISDDEFQQEDGEVIKASLINYLKQDDLIGIDIYAMLELWSGGYWVIIKIITA